MKSLTTCLLLPGALLLSLASLPALSQGGIASCADIDNAQERLACYDRAAEDASNLPVVRLPRNTRQAAPDTAANQGNVQQQQRQDEFGLEVKQERQQNRGPDSRSYTVLSARHNDFTGWTIEFDGGGTWKQIGTDRFDIEVGQRYTVRRSSFNSFMLSSEGSNKKIRITRVE